MKEDRISTKIDSSQHVRNALEETLRDGARQLLQQAIENEVQEFLNEYNGENQRWSALSGSQWISSRAARSNWHRPYSDTTAAR